MKTKRNLYINIIIVLSLSSLLVACGVPQKAKETSNLISGHTARIQKDMERFGENRKNIAKERYKTISNLRNSAIETRNANNIELRMWSIGKSESEKKDKRITLFEDIRAETEKAYAHHLELEQQKAETETFLAEMQSTINVNSAKLSETAKALAKLGEDMDLQSQIRFLYEFSRETNESLEQLNSDSEKK